MINMAKPSLGVEEQEAIIDVINTGMIACGKVVTEFEGAFAKFCGAKYGIATTSGTTALEIALRTLGIGKGDKVITTAFSFIATANAIIYTGAEPVFVDIDEESFNIDCIKLEETLKSENEIKAILIVHLFGRPCKMNKITQLAKEYKVFLIEDCAQAHGANCDGEMVGSFGDLATFSFYPTKNMTTGEGGMVITSNKHFADQARLLINHGMQTRYYHDIIGYNYRMTNISAAIGLCQLEKLKMFNSKRIENALYYIENIINDRITLPIFQEGHVFHQFTMKIAGNSRENFCKHLADKNIDYAIFYPLSMPEQKCYQDFNFQMDFPITDKIKHQVVSVPVHPLLSKDDLKEIVEAINSFKADEEK